MGWTQGWEWMQGIRRDTQLSTWPVRRTGWRLSDCYWPGEPPHTSSPLPWRLSSLEDTTLWPRLWRPPSTHDALVITTEYDSSERRLSVYNVYYTCLYTMYTIHVCIQCILYMDFTITSSFINYYTDFVFSMV